MEKGAVVESAESYFWSPLNWAAFHGHHKLVEMLFHKYDIALKILALNIAAFMGHLKVVKLLANIEINVQCYDNGCTALHLSAFQGHVDIVNLLISKGFDVNAKIHSYDPEKNSTNGILHHFPSAVSSMFPGIDSNYVLQFYGKTALHLSALKKRKEIVRTLLKNQAKICIRDDSGSTALRIILLQGMTHILNEVSIPACFSDCGGYDLLDLGVMKGDLLFVKLCIEKGYKIPESYRPLEIAVFFGHEEVTSYLIDCGADANAVGPYGNTLIEIALVKNRKNIARILFDRNAEISPGKEREYFLLAIRNGHDDIVDLFLTRNPLNAASRPEFQEFPLHTAVRCGHMNILQKLLELVEKKEVNEKNTKSATPLQIASEEGYCEIARLLLSCGANPNNMSDEIPPLHKAVVHGHFEMVEILIKSGANITQPDVNGNTAIELAVRFERQKIIETLLDFSKISVNLKGNNGRTLLHLAACSGSLEIVKCLIDRGALTNTRLHRGDKPIHVAAEYGHQDIVEYFLYKGLDVEDKGENGWSSLHYAAVGNQTEMCKFLIKNRLNINVVDAHDCTPLHVAAEYGNSGVVHTLLHYGAYYDFQNKRNQTPLNVAMTSSDCRNIPLQSSLMLVSSLFSAVQKNDFRKVEALLKEGLEFSELCYANIKNTKNISLLHFASRNGYKKIVDLLLKYNADPNMRGNSGSTVLHVAAQFSHPRIVKALLFHGAMFDVKNDSNKTPANCAKNRKIVKILDYLKTMFLKVENLECSISESLESLGKETAKIIMRARNSCGKILTALAVIKEHPETESLKSLFQDGVSIERDFLYEDELSEEIIEHTEVEPLKYFFESGTIIGLERTDIQQNEREGEEFLQVCKITLEKRIDLFGGDDPGVLDIQEIISEILICQKRYDEAQSLIEKSLRIRKEILGDSNKDTLHAMNLMARVLYCKDRKEDALSLYRKINEKQKYILGPGHADTLQSEIHIIHLMSEEEIENENLTKAVNMCLRILERINDSPEITNTILRLKKEVSFLMFKLGNLQEAFDICKEVFIIQKEKFGLHHSKTSDTLFLLAFFLFTMGESEDSLKAFKETLDIRRSFLGPNNEKTLESRFWIANVLYSQRMYHESLEIYQEDLTARTSILGANHPNILLTHEKIDLIHSQLK